MSGIERPERNPPPGAESIGPSAERGGSERWTRFYRRTPEYFRRLREKTLREWRKPPPALEALPISGILLDVGSGAGILCALAARGGALAVGLDVSIEGARAGRALAREHGLRGCLFVVGDAQDLPFRDGTFDAASHHATLEHLSDPEASLREVRRALRPGGRLVLFTVNALWPPRWRPSLLGALLASAGAPTGMEERPLRRRGFPGPDEASWRSGECLDTWRIPAPILRRMARRLLDEERYETFHLCREGRTRIDERLRVEVRRPSLWVQRARLAYLGLNRVPLVRHLGPVILWVGRMRGEEPSGAAC